MGRVLIIVACNFAYWQYDDGHTSRLWNFDVCERPEPVKKRPDTVADAVVVRRRPRPIRRQRTPNLNDLVSTTRRRK